MSHEGLQLDLEETLTRPVVRSGHRGGGGGARPASKLQRGAEREEGEGATPVHPPAAPAHPVSPRAAPAVSPSSPAPPASVAYYNLGTHFLWIGDRTRQLDHAHVEYFRGVANPVGIKAGPSSDPAEMVAVIRHLWPDPASAPGKIVIITRMGTANVRSKLPPLIRAVQEAGFTSRPVWVCDPMHGNTKNSSNGFKTREFDDILTELK